MQQQVLGKRLFNFMNKHGVRYEKHPSSDGNHHYTAHIIAVGDSKLQKNTTIPCSDGELFVKMANPKTEGERARLENFFGVVIYSELVSSFKGF